MNELCIALAQINPTVGALDHNADLIISQAVAAAEAGAQAVIFPELAVSGYPPEDLVLKEHFTEDITAQCARIAAAAPPDLVVIAGAPVRTKGRVYNAALVFQGGGIRHVYHKMRLPNYGVFDEMRVFDEGTDPAVLVIGSFRLGLHICEDSWSTEYASCRALADASLDGLLNLSASPYHQGKKLHRRGILAATARFLKAPLLYCNLVGGQDELVFDGGSMVLNAKGDLATQAALFREDLLIYRLPLLQKERPDGLPGQTDKLWKTVSLKINVDGPARTGETADRILAAGAVPPAPDARAEAAAPQTASHDLEDVYRALTLGLADYVNKNGFARVVIAISGGIDSALVAAIAVDALGPARVIGVTMPSRFSSEGTYRDAREIARRLEIEFHDVPIRRIHDVYLEELTTLWPGRNTDTTEENLQARIRGNIIMALSNKFGWLVVTTGNKSEMATGYCTLYGDMAGGFALIKDVPKTLVFALCHWRNGTSPEAPPIPESIIHRPPSAELRENQKDQDSLPPYEVLDAIIEHYVERDWAAGNIIAAGFDAAEVARVIHLIDGNEYKRRQGPPGVKITPKAFGRDRRLPITNLYHERIKTPRRAPEGPPSGRESPS